ncbi:hypothetical protein [Pseudomonas sp. UBA2684]|uniref:hypothetical protein n=1 Tax=Pseudomonas sp. UBA2684 TaxID=1947311 RepID=UPI0025EA77BD|nr:hypothetical protein [Pseudomonas sp. UBA2684]|tara:strand:- start:101 stop:469 length:369 start_codon:yes stop_codon:yes gene_type:complete
MKIGKYEVVHQASYLQMPEDDAIIEFSVLGDDVSFRIKFSSDDDSEEKPLRRIEGSPDPDDDERGLITFFNWRRPGATSSGDPMLVLTLGEGEERKDILFLAFVHYANRIYSVNIQFMLEVV